MARFIRPRSPCSHPEPLEAQLRDEEKLMTERLRQEAFGETPEVGAGGRCPSLNHWMIGWEIRKRKTINLSENIALKKRKIR